MQTIHETRDVIPSQRHDFQNKRGWVGQKQKPQTAFYKRRELGHLRSLTLLLTIIGMFNLLPGTYMALSIICGVSE